MSEINSPLGFTDRGDPATYDLTAGDMTTDGTWNDWDLSGIIDSGAKAVLLRSEIADGSVSQRLIFRKNGNAQTKVTSEHRTQVANINHDMEHVVAPDSNRVIEYFASNTTWSAIKIVVKGWWK